MKLKALKKMSPSCKLELNQRSTNLEQLGKIKQPHFSPRDIFNMTARETARFVILKEPREKAEM